MEVIVTSKAELLELIRAALQEQQTPPPGNTATGHDAPISLEEAAAYTGFAKSTIYSAVSANSIPHHKKNGRLFFFRSELKDWIKGGDEQRPGDALSAAESRLIAGRKKRRGV